jgi:WD40 repeat protein
MATPGCFRSTFTAMTDSTPYLADDSPDALLWQRWRQGECVDLDDFLAGFPGLDSTDLVAVLLIDQRERWQMGERIPAETYLRPFPALEDDPEAVVEMAYGEFLLREQRGERPAIQEYLWRFPEHEARLRQQVELRVALVGSDTSVASSITLEQRPAGPSGAPAVPGYDILGELGRGGMGVVYKARQVKADRIVALKMLLAGGHAGPSEMERFRSEAEAIARLHHRNIVQVYEVGEQAGVPFFSLEFCPGGSLDRRLAGKAMPPREAAALLERLALAVQAAHEKQIVHRDLKPANVLLQKDEGRRMKDESERGSPDSSLFLHPSGGIVTPSPTAMMARLSSLPSVTCWPSSMPKRKSSGRPLSSTERRLHGPPFPPDGKTVVGSTCTGEVYLWDRSAPRRPLVAPVSSKHPFTSVAINRNGQSIAKANWAEGVGVWQVPDRPAHLRLSAVGQRLKDRDEVAFAYDRTAIRALAVSPDGSLLATRGWNHTVELWQAQTGQAVRTLVGHGGVVKALAFSKDGKRLLSGSMDRTARLWDLETGHPVRRPLEHRGTVHSLAMSADGKRILTGAGNAACKLWKVTGEPLKEWRFQGAVWDVAYNPDGQTSAASYWQRVAVCDLAPPYKVRFVPSGNHHTQGVAFSPDGKRWQGQQHAGRRNTECHASHRSGHQPLAGDHQVPRGPARKGPPDRQDAQARQGRPRPGAQAATAGQENGLAAEE